jgi:hypothetical protein
MSVYSVCSAPGVRGVRGVYCVDGSRVEDQHRVMRSASMRTAVTVRGRVGARVRGCKKAWVGGVGASVMGDYGAQEVKP